TRAAAGMRPEYAKPLALRCTGTQRVAGRAVSIFIGLGRGRLKMGERGFDLWVSETGQALASGATGRNCGQALLELAPMLLQMQRHHRFHPGALVGVKIAARDQVIGQGLAPGTGPCLKRGDKLTLVDQAVLKCQQAEKQVSGGGHGAGLLVTSSECCRRSFRDCGVLRPSCHPEPRAVASCAESATRPTKLLPRS